MIGSLILYLAVIKVVSLIYSQSPQKLSIYFRWWKLINKEFQNWLSKQRFSNGEKAYKFITRAQFNKAITASALKSYTEKQKIDFIVEYNHQKGYEIRETETSLEAWGKTNDEILQEKKAQRNQEILSKVKEIELMALSDLIKGNTVKDYKQVAESLLECMEN